MKKKSRQKLRTKTELFKKLTPYLADFEYKITNKPKHSRTTIRRLLKTKEYTLLSTKTHLRTKIEYWAKSWNGDIARNKKDLLVSSNVDFSVVILGPTGGSQGYVALPSKSTGFSEGLFDGGGNYSYDELYEAINVA